MPRRKVDFSSYSNYWESRKVFKKEDKEIYNYLKELGYTNYKKLIREINGKVAKYTIENPLGLKLPYAMGNITVMKRRSNMYDVLKRGRVLDEKKPEYNFLMNSYTDWKSSKELKQRVIFTNDHSDGYKFQFYWNKSGTKFPNKELYFIAVEKKWKKYLHDSIVAGNQHYSILKSGKSKYTLLTKYKIK